MRLLVKSEINGSISRKWVLRGSLFATFIAPIEVSECRPSIQRENRAQRVSLPFSDLIL
jgi:hypothetical protein